jgi:tRNA (guanine-N7-)-methyltransferase
MTPRFSHGRRWHRTWIRGRENLTVAQRRALREAWPSVGLTPTWGVPLDPTALYGRTAPWVLDLGFGMGESLLQRATARPDMDFLGIEVHRPGLARVAAEVVKRGLTNVRLVKGDGLKLLQDHLEDAVLDEICVFFPDPFPSPHHAQRRLWNAPFLELAAARVRAGGTIHLATDVEVYATHAAEVTRADTRWQPRGEGGPTIPRPPHRPWTKYEQRAHTEGRSVHDLCWSRGRQTT